MLNGNNSLWRRYSHDGFSSLYVDEKQRISIACAMIKDVSIVILDDCEIIGLTRRNPIKTRVLLC